MDMCNDSICMCGDMDMCNDSICMCGDMDMCNDSICMCGDIERDTTTPHMETWMYATTLMDICNDSICMRISPCSASKSPCGDLARHICKKRSTYPQKSPKSTSKSHYSHALLRIQVSTRISPCLRTQQGDLHTQQGDMDAERREDSGILT